MSKWFIILAFVASSSTLLACMAAPQPLIWHTPKGAHHFSVTEKGEVTVVDAKDHKKVIWKTTLTKHVQYADMIHLVDDGTRIVCVRSNSRVNKVEDVAIETISKDGKRSTVKASKFIAKLEPGTPPGQPRMSIAPNHRWMKQVKKVDEKGITIVNAAGKEKSVAWKES